MPFIAEFTLPSGNTYKLKDEEARELISQLLNFNHWLGVTTTALTDGATTNPIVVNGESVTAENGDVATYNTEEFIFNGTIWQKFGDLSGLGSLAYKNSASGSFTPAGTNTGGNVTLNTDTVKSMKTEGTAPSATMPAFTMNGETLVITDGTFDAGAMPTFEDKTVAIGVDQVTPPTFSGTSGTVTVQ